MAAPRPAAWSTSRCCRPWPAATTSRELTGGYGLVVVDECHHIPAAAFEHAVRQIPARRWLGLTATPYRRDQLDDLIALQLGPIRHTITHPTPGPLAADAARSSSRQPGSADPVLHVHDTDYRYTGDADPPAPGGMAAIYRDLVADDARTDRSSPTCRRPRPRTALPGPHPVDRPRRRASPTASATPGTDPVVLRGGMGAKARRAALARLQPPDGAAAGRRHRPLRRRRLRLPGTGHPLPRRTDRLQRPPRPVRRADPAPAPGKTTAEVHDYHDIATGVLASSLAKRAPGYTSLGFPDPRKIVPALTVTLNISALCGEGVARVCAARCGTSPLPVLARPRGGAHPEGGTGRAVSGRGG